jgi:starch synthase (maltosyl-transferring)
MASINTETLPDDWSRIVISSISPLVDNGRWPVRRSLGENVDVVAGLILDGHDRIAAELVYRPEGGDAESIPMTLRYNDEYHASFAPRSLGRHHFQVHAWLDAFGTWHGEFRRRVDGGESDSELRTELKVGTGLLEGALERSDGADRDLIQVYLTRFANGEIEAALEEGVLTLGQRYQPRGGLVSSQEVTVIVDPELARFGAWYEFFPRSAASEPGVHGTLDDAADRLPRIKEMGFDIVYLPPVHPIGTTFRKGKDNNPKAKKGEPGSPWAIGAEDGGHKAVHAELGGMEAFDRFVARAEELGLTVAIDIAYQTSPDHPYVREHPEWFKHRPDGTIRYAENPPKKYQDVYPFDFESDAWRELWHELRDVFEFWIDHGVRVFRVDNPHTKSIAFWEWCIRTLREKHPDLIFLSEAFARPKMMYTLAKLGFNNSYTYFTWRNTKQELTQYAQEIFESDVADYFRPNFWPNTPDILHEYLVYGGRPAHIVRFILAATMSSAYGIYGPPYEHVANKQHPAREEYADNEKYEIRTWNWNDPHSLQPLFKRVNQIRRRNRALHFMRNIRFHEVDNPQLIAYSKHEGDNTILVVVNLDPHHEQSGWLSFDPKLYGLQSGRPFQVHDLLGGERYLWQGDRHFIQLNPHIMPAHIFQVLREVSSEQDFPYYQ